MINSLQAKNFKSWSDTGKLELAPLTGLFGTNSSGKTSILQLLLMLKQTVESSLSTGSTLSMGGDDNSLVDLGTFRDLIHNHNNDTQLDIELSWDIPEELKDDKTEKVFSQIKELTFSVSIIKEEEKTGPVVKSFAYSFDNKKFGMSRKKKENEEVYYDLISNGYIVKRNRGRQWLLPSPIKCYGFPAEVRAYYQKVGFLSDFELYFGKLFSQIAYLGPLRDYPKRNYLWNSNKPTDVGKKGEHTISALLISEQSPKKSIAFGRGSKKKAETVEERVGHWLKELGMIHKYSLKPIAKDRKEYELKVQKTATSAEVLITDVGFGVSQILPILVLCYYVPEGSVIILEQPEIHLHPSAQAVLADVFIEVVKSRKVQIILESHSEHLLRRLQRRIAEEKISNDETALYFCSMENSASKIEKLNVDQFGNIINWPKNFFGNEMEERVAMIDASIKRQQRTP